MTEEEEQEGIEVGEVCPPQNKHPMARPQEKAFAAETAGMTDSWLLALLGFQQP